MKGTIVCIGSSLIDELYFCNENALLGTSNPAQSNKNIGGVISNIAQHLAHLGHDVEYLTVLGNDTDASWLEAEFHTNKVSLQHAFRVNDKTGKYISILNPDGSLFTAACADHCADYITTSLLHTKIPLLKKASLIVIDTNISTQCIQWIIDFTKEHNIPLIIEPVSVLKAAKLKELNLNGVFLITPNQDELQSISTQLDYNEEKTIEQLLNKGIQQIWVRKGEMGSTIYDQQEQLQLNAVNIQVKDSTGAGDAALAGWISYYLNGSDKLECLKAGHALAFEVLQITGAVHHRITPSSLPELILKYYKNDQ